jgi:hypothetical protein
MRWYRAEDIPALSMHALGRGDLSHAHGNLVIFSILDVRPLRSADLILSSLL